MNYDKVQHLAIAQTFQALHKSGCFVIPNPWDTGTAVYLAHLGFKALATTSAGYAFSNGLPDEPSAHSRASVLAHVSEIVAATSLPVNADYQNGYADAPEAVAESVKLCVETGTAGLSIEDATGDPTNPLYDEKLAVERIRAAREAIDNSGIPVVLTARCEAWLVQHPDARETALKRLVAFAEAGADCLYAPGVVEATDISDIVKAVAPKPVNVLMFRPGFTLSQLADLGVRRVSVGSSLSRVAWGAFMRAATKIFQGDFGDFADTASFVDLNKVFAGRSD